MSAQETTPRGEPMSTTTPDTEYWQRVLLRHAGVPDRSWGLHAAMIGLDLERVIDEDREAALAEHEAREPEPFAEPYEDTSIGGDPFGIGAATMRSVERLLCAGTGPVAEHNRRVIGEGLSWHEGARR